MGQYGVHLHIGEQLQLGELLRFGPVQIERTARIVLQHLGERGEVDVVVVAELLGHGLDALLDHVAQLVLRIVALGCGQQGQAQEQPRRLPHSKR